MATILTVSRLRRALGLGTLLGCTLAQAQTEDPNQAAVFDSGFLHQVDGQPGVDLSIFSHTNRVLPGVKSVQLRLNGQPLGARDIEFRAVEGQSDAQPCLPVALLEQLGLNLNAVPTLQAAPDFDCMRTLSQIPRAAQRYDFDKHTLNLSIPQAMLTRVARGLVPAELWDQGETAFWSSYRVSQNRAQAFGETSNTTFLSLRNGLNIGAWRLRANGSLYHADGSSTWNTNDLYAERDIAAWRGSVRLGDSNTNGSIFTSTRFRGVQLQSDNGMLPDSQRGYAPVIRGIANGNAKVVVRQNGYVIYTTFVPAGPFVIDDLYSTPGAGDLEVEVEELGGQTTTFFQPFSALPIMMREGVWNYSFAAGKHRSRYSGGGDGTRPLLFQGTAAYGLPFGLTAYGGWTSAQGGYHAGSLGVAMNMEDLGAVSLDATSSRSRTRQGDTLVGTAARIQYAKSFASSGTDFTLASYRYNSSGYRSLDEAIQDRNNDPFESLRMARQHEYQLSLSQRIGEKGSLALNYYGIGYHNLPGKSEYAQISYASSYERIGYALNFGLNKSPWQSRQSTVMLTLSLPLGGSQTLSYTLARNSADGVRNDVNLSGALTDDYTATYALQAGTQNPKSGQSGANIYGALSYAGSSGVVNFSHASAKNNHNTNLELSGALVVDSGGVLLGQNLGETAIIVNAPGAVGMSVDAYPGVQTNEAGRALVPYASPYRENRISLSQTSRDATATVQDNVQIVVPTRGAIAVAHFDTRIGRTLIASLSTQNGAKVPFGATVYNSDNEQIGVVGPVGRTWLTGLQGLNRYTVKWGEHQEQTCHFDIEVSPKDPNTDATKELTCV